MGFYYAPLAKLERQLERQRIAPLVEGKRRRTGRKESGDALEIMEQRSETSSQGVTQPESHARLVEQRCNQFDQEATSRGKNPFPRHLAKEATLSMRFLGKQTVAQRAINISGSFEGRALRSSRLFRYNRRLCYSGVYRRRRLLLCFIRAKQDSQSSSLESFLRRGSLYD